MSSSSKAVCVFLFKIYVHCFMCFRWRTAGRCPVVCHSSVNHHWILLIGYYPASQIIAKQVLLARIDFEFETKYYNFFQQFEH